MGTSCACRVTWSGGTGNAPAPQKPTSNWVDFAERARRLAISAWRPAVSFSMHAGFALARGLLENRRGEAISQSRCVVSVSSVASSNPYAQLQSLLSQPSGTDPSQAPSDPLQAPYQSFSGGSSSDPLLAAIGGDADSSSSLPPVFSADMMQALLTVQNGQGGAGGALSSLIGQFDANGDGQISQSEFEKAIGTNADQSKVDALFGKIDANGDGSISDDEMQSAMQKAHGVHHQHHHGGGGAQAAGKGGGDPLQALLSGASADGTTSQTASNADGSTTTTITYSDGTKVAMTTPAAAPDAGADSAGSSASPTFASLLKQLISLQAQVASQFAAPITSLTV
jgi:hypothetical protein